DEEAEALFSTLVRMFMGVLTGVSSPLQPLTPIDGELVEMLRHPSLHQMLKYSFIGSKQTVKKQVKEFLDQTQVDELITVTPTYAHEDRVKSLRLFAEVMDEINAE